MESKTQELERRIGSGESIFDIGRSVELDQAWCEEIDKILSYQDTGSEIQIENGKNLAVAALTDILSTCEDPQAQVQAARTLLTHYRDEKKRLEFRRKEKVSDPYGPLVGTARDLFGGWELRAPSK